MWLKHFVWIFSLIATSFACSSFEYFSPENDYHYKYSVNVESSAVGTTNRKTGSEITCDVHILNTVTGQCHYLLQVDKCILSDLGKPSADGASKLVKNAKSEQFSLQISRYSTYFTLSNGSVSTIAFHKDETLVAANVKRGIISSALTKTQAPDISTKPETRDDVQGSCSVVYTDTSIRGRRKITMEKDITTCDFPSKSDWHFSPYSLLWNMSVVQTLLINSTMSCTYEFSSSAQGLRLESSVCKERHARKLESTRNTDVSVQTNIKQKLTFSEVSPSKKSPEKIAEKYRSTSIHFEYEKSTVPAKNSPDVDSKIRGLVNEIGMDLEKEQQGTEITAKFGELIDLLRVTPDLDKFAQRIVECANSKECMEPDRVHKTQILIYALVQCHHTQCLKVIRQVAGIPKDSLEVLMNDNFLNGFFVALTDAEIKDVTFIKELKEICTIKPIRKQCVLALASIVHSLWTEKHDDWTQRTKLPSEIVDVLEFVLNIPPAETGEGRVLQFKAIGTLGDLLEQYKPDILDWLFKLQVSNLDHVSKIEAFRRFKPSDALYAKLATVLKSDSFPQEDRVTAYTILADKFHNKKLAEDVEAVLLANTTEHNLRLFIFTHLFALTKSADYSTAKFARDRVDLLSSMVGYGYFEEMDTNSDYTEDSFWKTVSFLPQPYNTLGLTAQSTELYDGQDPTSFYMKDNVIVHLLGKDFNIADASIYLQGIDKLREQVQSSMESDWKAKSLKKFLKRFGSVGDLSALLPKYVDPTIVQRLQEIREAFISKLKPSKPLNFLFSVGSDGDASSYFTYVDLIKYLEDHYISFIKGDHSASKNLPKTRYIKLIEAVNLVPTLAGISLNWTADAYYLSKSELLNQDENPLKFDFRVGISASFRNRMLVDVPGFTECGVQSITTASLAFNGLLEGNRDESIINIGLLQQPAHIGFARKNYLIRGYSLESIADWDVKRTNQDWCSDILVPSVGLKLCHSRSYAQVTDRPDKPWALMAGDSHWNYTLRNVNDQRTVYSLKKESTTNAIKNDFKLVLLKSKSKQTADSAEEKEIFKYLNNKDKKYQEIHLGVQNSTLPHILIRDDPKELMKPNQSIALYATIYISPKIKYDFNLSWFGASNEEPRYKLSTELFRSNSTDLIHVDETEVRSFVTTATGQVYSLNYNEIRSPIFESKDYAFRYFCGSSPCNTWTKDVFPSEAWDDKQSFAGLTIRANYIYPKKTTFDQKNRVVSYEVETPKYIYKIKRTNEFHTGVGRFTHFNVTKYIFEKDGDKYHYKLQTFLDVSFGSKSGFEDGFNVTQYLATLTVPELKYSADFKSKRREGQLQYYLGFLRNPSVGLPVTPPVYPKYEKKGIEFNFIEKDRSVPERQKWSDYKTNWDITSMFHRTQQITYSGHFSRGEHVFDWNQDFELHIPQLNLDIESETTSAKTTNNVIVLHHTNFTTLRHSLGSFHFNMTKVLAEPPNVVHFRNVIVVDSFIETSLHFITGLEPCDDKKNGYGTFEFFVETPNSPIMNSVFKGNACRGARFFEADFQNPMISGKMIGNAHKGTYSIDSSFEKTPGLELGMYNVDMKFVFPDEFPYDAAIFQVHFPETNRTYYELFHYYPFIQQFSTTACSGEICTDIKSNPETFIAQVFYDLSDDDHIYRSLTVNNMNKFSDLFRIASGFQWNNKRRLNTYDYDVIVKEIPELTLPPHPLLDSFKFLLSPITNYVKKLGSTNWKSSSVSGTLSGTHIAWFWKYFDGKAIAKKFVFGFLEENWQFHQMEIENGRGTHYFVENPRSIIMAPDTYLPGITSKTYRELVQFFGISSEHYNYREMFHIDGYDRHAVLFDNRNVYTFDHRPIQDVKSTYQQCPFLLTSDVRPNHFSIYVHNEYLHLLFPEVHVRIANNGSVYLDDIDIPINLFYFSESYAVRISINEDIVKVETEYSLAVKCVISYEFCIFYTNDDTYGNLVGLLGNNNDDAMDDLQPLDKWNLSSDKSCAPKKKSNDTAIDPYGEQNSYCYGVFGGGYYRNHLVFQGADIVSPFLFRHSQCESESANACSTGLAYVAMVAASDVDIQGQLFPCMQCGDHYVDEKWLEKVEPLLEVVFVVNDDTEQLKAADVVKNLQELSTVISKEFEGNGFQSTKFGLLHVGCHRKHCTYAFHHEHKFNGSDFFTSKEFAKDTRFDYGTSINDSRGHETVLDALEKASDYPFDPKAVHVVVLVTSADEDGRYGQDEYQDTLLQFEEKGIILYTISNFPEVPKHNEIFGIRSDGHTIPQPQYKESVVEFPKGIYAKVTSATKGAVWLLSHLESNSATSTSYDQTIAKELLTRAKQDTSQCRSCRCAVPKHLEPEARCHYVKC